VVLDRCHEVHRHLVDLQLGLKLQVEQLCCSLLDRSYRHFSDILGLRLVYGLLVKFKAVNLLDDPQQLSDIYLLWSNVVL
jgi:hypothetical protein